MNFLQYNIEKFWKIFYNMKRLNLRGLKMEEILNKIENKDIEYAGGSVVGVVLSTINALIIYISSLTINKKNYENVQDDIKKIIVEAKNLKRESKKAIDEDSAILKKLLSSYKKRNTNYEEYKQICMENVEFCLEVLNIAYSTLELSDEISKIGNKMLSSDFEICKYYSYASVKSAITNVEINLNQLKDEEYKHIVEKSCNTILEKSKKIINN